METGTETVNMSGVRVHVVRALTGKIAQGVTQKKGFTNEIRRKGSFTVRRPAGVCRVDVDSPGGVMKGWWILPSGLIGLSLLACWLVYVVVLK